MDLKVTRACYSYEILMSCFINLCTFDYLEIAHLCYFQGKKKKKKKKKSISKRKQYTSMLLEQFFCLYLLGLLILLMVFSISSFVLSLQS